MKNYEKIIRRLIDDGNESPKVDFKSSVDFSQKASIADLARLVIGMANSDSDELDDIGFIILGAKPGKLLGGMQGLAGDAARAAVPVKLNRYVTPPARIEVRAYEDPDKGWFGALLIRPSQAMRPHFIAKEYSSLEKALKSARVRKNECFVRRGESVELAGRDDFDRMYQQRFELQFRASEERDTRLPEPHLSWLANGDGDAALQMIEMPPAAPLSKNTRQRPLLLREKFSEQEMAEFDGEERKPAETYNRACEAFFQRWSEVESEHATQARAEVAVNFLYLRCENRGNAPLTDANVFLEFPDGFELLEQVPSLPVLPDPPVPPNHRYRFGSVGGLMARMGVGRGVLNSLSASTMPSLVPRRSTPPLLTGLSRDGDLRLQGWVKKVRHGGFYVDFNVPAIIVPPEKPDIYEIHVEVYCDELATAHRGTLKIKVAPGAAKQPYREAP